MFDFEFGIKFGAIVEDIADAEHGARQIRL
jgi:hypothetical protein